jgi:hypothetical protein
MKSCDKDAEESRQRYGQEEIHVHRVVEVNAVEDVGPVEQDNI